MKRLIPLTLLLLLSASAQVNKPEAPTQESHIKEDVVLQRFSDRAKQVLFLARIRAGQRGGQNLSVDDLVVALILEDQGRFSEALSAPGSGKPNAALPMHKPFLDATLADNIFGKIEALQKKEPATPKSFDMPVSGELGSVFEDAVRLADESHEERVQPLHLLAAAAADQSSNAAELLREAGITKAQVMKSFQQKN